MLAPSPCDFPVRWLLAIDPGCDTGWAIFDDTRLIDCGLYSTNPPKGEYTRPLYQHYDRLVIECPMLRPRGEKNPNAILKLARNAGEWAGRYDGDHSPVVEYILPNAWKGTTKDDVSTARTKMTLTPEESKLVHGVFAGLPGRNGLAESRRHNVYDAIGIGLWAVGRKASRASGSSALRDVR